MTNLSRAAQVVTALAAAMAFAAEPAAEVTGAAPAPADAPGTSVHARLDLSQLVAGDDLTGQRTSYTDLRLVADAARSTGPRLSFRLDGRGRKSWTELAADRLSVTEAYLRYGGEGDAWRATAGRQLIRAVASAEVDGVGVEKTLGEGSSAVAFGGFLPHPLTGDPNLDFIGAGAGYERRTESANHAGGALVSLYRGGLDRFYLTQSSYLTLSQQVVASGFAIVDVAAPSGLFGPGPDLTTLSALVRYRPVRSFDSTLSVNHNHTLVPSRWWRDWLYEQRRLQGFTLDGDEPVGTRVTSARWTNVLWASRETAPYLRLRYDVRHTEAARGYEAAAGVKWRPRLGYADASLSYRRFFGAEAQLATVQLGFDQRSWGAEGGASLLRSRPLDKDEAAFSFEGHAFAWVELGELLASAKGVRALVEYQAFVQSQTTYQVGLAQLGYRF